MCRSAGGPLSLPRIVINGGEIQGASVKKKIGINGGEIQGASVKKKAPTHTHTMAYFIRVIHFVV